MDFITRQFGLLCLGALAAALTACPSNDVTLCEKAGILCPSGTHCAGIEAVCIQDSNLCGDGKTDPGEVCDDGNTQDGDTCSKDCKSDLSCGNKIVDIGAKVPEQCDDGPNNGQIGSSCSATCQLVKCGNGVVEQGEQCDDSNVMSGDGCSSTCQNEFCGNGHIDKEAGEVCDDGDKNGTPNDPCSANCRSNLSCNNGIVDPGEECDHGKLGDGNPTGNDNANDCRADCQFNQCGDGLEDKQSGQRHEECDAGHLTEDSFHQLVPVPTEAPDCNIDCTAPSCGDGNVNRHFKPDGTHTEQCDSGKVNGVNQNQDTAVCTSTCQLNVCGDGHPWAGIEACDDGGVNTNNCNANCTKPTCGDGLVNAAFVPTGAPGPEQCDNGTVNNVNQNQDSAACTSKCQVNVCGDNNVLAGVEQCDPGKDALGHVQDTSACDHDCTLPVCGDGIVNDKAGEACDDGVKNGTAASPNHCNQFCQINTCGNGVLDPGEDCDAGSNGVKTNSAACDSNCTFATCGDNFTNPVAGEACDEGAANGTLAGPTHCNQFCQFNSCGDGILEPGEQCDDGTTSGTNNNHAGARCNATCQFNVCGDSDKLEGVEACDPGHDAQGNPKDTPACDRDCTLPVCGDGVPNTLAGEQCDDGVHNGEPGHCNRQCKSIACGNGVIDVGEECDDGVNGVQTNSARCNADCTFARCGDGKVNPQFKPDGVHVEVCDKLDLNTGAPLNGVPCDYGDPNCTRCNATCTGDVNPGGPFCGDGLQQTGEQCDPTTGPALTLPSPLARADSATCDIDCTPVTCGDGHLNAVALETCDDGNLSACGTCPSITATDCRGATPITPTQATSTIITTTGDLIGDLDTLKLDDGFGKTIMLEFDLGGLQDQNSVPVSFAQAPATDAATIASRMVDAINTKAPVGFLITASVPMGGTTVTLTHSRKSLFGNTPITVTGLIGTATGFTFSASPPRMAGGLAGDCVTGTGCVFADDCKSGVCNPTTHQCQ